MSPSRRWLRWGGGLSALLVLAAGFTYWRGKVAAAAAADAYRWARATRGDFRQVVRRQGQLSPVNEEHIIGKIRGTIEEIAPEGKPVNKGDLVLKLDPTQYEDAETAHESWIARVTADQNKQRQWEAMSINQAKEDANSSKLARELEQMRLDELKKGPTPADVVNANTDLENARNLLAASKDECEALRSLADNGWVSKVELRQKELEVEQQRLAVVNADIGLRKLYEPDPVKLAGQELKMRNAAQAVDAAGQRVKLLERNSERDEEARKRRMAREEAWLAKLKENVEKCYYRAPASGNVIYEKPHWFNYAPGRDVRDGWDVMSIPDFSKMKVALTVDEAHIAYVKVGQSVEVLPAGWDGPAFHGKVTRVAEKGHDEFELYKQETIDIVGTANRQVFDVEAEIEGQSPAFRPGLRSKVEILVKELPKTVLVPRMAVFHERDGSAFVRVAVGGEIAKRPVTVLGENDFSAALEGVAENERVLLLDAQK